MKTETDQSTVAHQGIIKILPENLANKIAAGEVVDRPASVVKELVENSLDSDAYEITVILKEGGKTLLQVVDDGVGMSESDLILAFQRHATSKINTADDLQNIATLGFRGEALASIASVSQVEARSVPRGAASGHSIAIEGGVMHEVEAAAGKPGSSIAVKNLFYNTPARRKFLKTQNTEYRQIISVLNRFYLSHPEVSFTFVNDGEVVHELRKESLADRVGAVLGPRVQQNMLPIENQGPVQITGFIGNQDVVRRSRGDQYMYFNRRFFSNKSLGYAVVVAYGEILPRGSHPMYIVFIEMPPEEVDVNVHPTKMEIKFANDSLVFTSVRGAVKRALTSHNIVPEITKWNDFSQASSSGSPGRPGDFSFRPERPQSAGSLFPGWPGAEDRMPAASPAPAQQELLETHSHGEKKALFERTNIWQVHNKYIVSQIKNGLIIIDQHVAHERVLYEQALTSFEIRKPSSQQLLFPQIHELSQQDYAILLEIQPFLQHIGFIIKAFGKNTVVVEGVPSGLKVGDDEKILLRIADEYKRGKKDRTEIRENVAASYACHSAIRAGDSLSLDEMNALIDQLFSTREPYFCPHGRPVLIHMSLDELDKRFKRV